MEFDYNLVSCISCKKHNEAKFILQKYQYLYKLVDSSGQTLLHVSAKYGNSEITRYLIQCGCKVDAQDHLGITPLMLAITDGQDGATIEVLLQANADIYLTDTEKSSSLRKVVKTCQTWFKNLDTESPQKMKYFGVLRVIFSKVEKEFVVNKELMVERLHEVDCPFALVIFMNNVAMTEYVLGAGFFFDDRVGGLSALHIAVALSDIENLTFLLGYGADVNDRDNQQRTPLFFYDESEIYDSKQLYILKTLVDHGASLTLPRSDGVTLMEYFFANGHGDILKTLVQTGTDELKKLTPDGRTPLHFLARNINGVFVMKLLLKKINIDIDARDVGGKTALVEAVSHLNVEQVEFLTNAGAKVNLIDIFDRTVLFSRLRSNSGTDIGTYAHSIINSLVHRGNCYCSDKSFRPTSSVQNYQRKMFDLAKLMLKHLTLDEASGESVNEATLMKIRSNKLLSRYYDSCKLQLRRMTQIIVYGTVTLYELISKSEEKIALYARNEDFIEAFKIFMKGKSCGRYYYFHFLKKRIESAIKRVDLRRKASCVVCDIFQLYGVQRYPDDDLFYEIVTYLDDRDLHNLLSV